MAETISRFDLVAVPEVAGSLIDLRLLLNHRPASYQVIFSSVGGNEKRVGFLYDTKTAGQLQLAVAVAVPPK